MKRSTLIIVIAVALLGVVVSVAAAILHDGLSARATPTKLEIMIARNARHLAIPSNARQTQNPMLDSPEDLRAARLRAEREVIHIAWARSNHTASVAARLLGISRPTLYGLLEAHGIEVDSGKPGDAGVEIAEGRAELRVT